MSPAPWLGVSSPYGIFRGTRCVSAGSVLCASPSEAVSKNTAGRAPSPTVGDPAPETEGGGGGLQGRPPHPVTSCAPVSLRSSHVPLASVLPAGGSPGGGGVPGHSSSLPELQCFISDSQLTRDAALHLGLGDMEEPPAALDVCCATHGCVWLFCQASRLQDR